MRGREFLMKDCYSFDLDYAGALRSYRKMMLAYMRTFQRLGVVPSRCLLTQDRLAETSAMSSLGLAPTGEGQVFYDGELEKLDYLEIGNIVNL